MAPNSSVTTWFENENQKGTHCVRWWFPAIWTSIRTNWSLSRQTQQAEQWFDEKQILQVSHINKSILASHTDISYFILLGENMRCSATNLASALNSSLANCLRWSAPIFFMLLCCWCGPIQSSWDIPTFATWHYFNLNFLTTLHWFITARPNFNDWNGHNIWRSFGSFFINTVVTIVF